ncbi:MULTISPECIES: hypothetical protein [unclassified Brevundimonas]|uniref:hypothetical protein n=1 Tax=unclassified Brevundimonas TaxID=2622653 RepID=UPI0025BBB2D2|nr:MULTISPECIES: hypothetical protein [unclassified Brevundimonas]
MKRLLLAAAVSLGACAQPQERAAPVYIDPSVFEPYTEQQFPQLFATIGEEEITGRIQRLRENAANRVGRSPDCTVVERSEYSEARSTPTNPQVFVDCSNGKRWRMTERDVLYPAGKGEPVAGL